MSEADTYKTDISKCADFGQYLIRGTCGIVL